VVLLLDRGWLLEMMTTLDVNTIRQAAMIRACDRMVAEKRYGDPKIRENIGLTALEAVMNLMPEEALGIVFEEIHEFMKKWETAR
jgi:hypothetical protein